MTSPILENENCFARLAWTGVETTFDPSFNAIEKAHVVVKFEDEDGVTGSALTLDTHYSLALGANNAVTLTPLSLPPAPGYLRIERVTPAIQEIDFADLSGFSADIHTKLHTMAAMRAAENRRRVAVTEAAIALLESLGVDMQEALAAAEQAATNAQGSLNSVTALIAQSTIMYFHAGAPDDAFGKDGDVYVNTAASTWPIYGPKAAGAWGASTGDLKPVAGNVSAANNAAAADRLLRAAAADKTIKDSPVSLDDSGNLTNVQSITLLADPDAAMKAATKQYVDQLAANIGKRGAVRVATTANVTISTALNSGDSIDGVTLADGDLVLVKSQSAPAENGIYVVGAVPARDAQFDTYNEHAGALIVVQEGTTLADTSWLCTSNKGGTLNSTAIAFSRFIPAGVLGSADIGVLVQAYDANTTKNNASNVFTGLNTIQALKEKVTITAGAPASTQNFDVLTQAVQYFTSNNANNWTLNVRGDGSNSLDSIMSIGQSITIEVIVTNGGTAYRHTAMTIDGNAVTPQWLGAAAPAAGTVSKRDTYTFQIIKTAAATFTVQASFASGN